MDDKIQVLGITIDNLSVESAMERAESFLEDDVLDLIGFISSDLLLEASQERQLRDEIERMDLSVAADREILEACQIKDEKRLEETEKNVFMKAFFMCLSDRGCSIFALASNQEQAEQFRIYIGTNYPGIRIVGEYPLDERSGDDDTVINEVNSAAPDVLFSLAGGVSQEHFMFRNKAKLSVKIWVGLGHHEKAWNSIGLKPGWLSKLVDKTLFKRTVAKYLSSRGE